MSYIIFIFINIVFHICVDYCKAQAARLEASDLAKNSALIATAPNNIGYGRVYNLAYSDHHDLEAVLSFPISLEKDDEARRPLKLYLYPGRAIPGSHPPMPAGAPPRHPRNA